MNVPQYPHIKLSRAVYFRRILPLRDGILNQTFLMEKSVFEKGTETVIKTNTTVVVISVCIFGIDFYSLQPSPTLIMSGQLVLLKILNCKASCSYRGNIECCSIHNMNKNSKGVTYYRNLKNLIVWLHEDIHTIIQFSEEKEFQNREDNNE